MSFNPTHEFRGLLLRYEYDYDVIDGVMVSWYVTENDEHLCLPNTRVTKIPPKPQPGEVWKYVNPDDPDPFRLVLVTLDFPPSFVNEEGDTVPFAGNDHLMNFVKVLNADGTPA